MNVYTNTLNINVNIYTTESRQYQGDSVSKNDIERDKQLNDTIKGKPQPWRDKKTKTMRLAKAFRAIGEHEYKRANRIWWCGAELGFADNSVTGGMTLKEAHFCRERLCVMCNWRKSIKTFYQVSRVYDVAQEENPNVQSIFLTLTVRNCVGSELKGTIDKMFAAWHKLFQHSRIKKAGYSGWFRALEVTYNKKTDTYHPHFHAIILVDKQYFFEPKRYLHTEEISKLWGTSLGTDYNPTCDVRAVRGGGEKKYKAVAEVAKYTTKDSEYIFDNEEKTVEVVGVLQEALYRRRLYAFGGVMKIIAKRLGAENPEDGDLVNIDEEKAVMREEIAEALTVYEWDFGLKDYFRRV